jgi:hypothetical protein
MLYLLNDRQHKLYPFNLVETMCINTNNLKRVVSSTVTLLVAVFEQGMDEEESEQYRAFVRGQIKEAEKNPLLVVKILHLLYHLTDNYSLAMQFLKVNDAPVASLRSWMRPPQESTSSLELLICLLPKVTGGSSPEALKFLIDLIENITTQHFYKSINALVGQSAETHVVNQSI